MRACLAGLAFLVPRSAAVQSPSAVATFGGEAACQTDAGAIGVAPDSGGRWREPLAPYGASLSSAGLSFDFNADEDFFSNPGAGLHPGQLSNATYFVLNLDADLNTGVGIRDGWFHFTESVFGFRFNNRNMGSDIGDSTVGYQPTHNRDVARLSVLIHEQRLLDDQLHLAAGQDIFFEPVVQYLVNGNSYWNPYTANRSKDGSYVGATLIVPLGLIFGLAPD